MLRTSHILLVLGGAVVTGGLFGAAPSLLDRMEAAEPVKNCRVIDGDTLRCGEERVRLLGIDAPELPGHCQPGRACAPGDPFASTESLREALQPPLTLQRLGQDRYGRTLALASSAKGDLSCWQLSHRQAIYKPKWDNGGRLARICAAAR